MSRPADEHAPGAEPRWLAHVRRLHAIAQTGLHWAKDPYDIERYEMIRAIAAEIAADGSGDDAVRLDALFAREEGYVTPKLDSRAAVFRGDTVLLVRERVDGLWTMPGGWMDVGESPAENTVREVAEESGLRVRATRLLALYDRTRHPHPPIPFHVYKVFFLCEPLDDAEPAPASQEILEAAFFPLDALPPLSEGRVTAVQIARMNKLRHSPSSPVDFD